MTTGCGSLFLQGGRYGERDVIKELTRGGVSRRRLGKELGRNLGELIHLNVNLTPTDFLRKERLAFNFKIGIFFYFLKKYFPDGRTNIHIYGNSEYSVNSEKENDNDRAECRP